MRFAISFVLGALIGYPLTLFAWVSLVSADPHGGGEHGVAALSGYGVVMSGLLIAAPLGALITGLAIAFLLREAKGR